MKPQKCVFNTKSVVYLGHQIDRERLHRTEEKVKALERAPRPRNVTELKSFLGLMTYYGKSISQLSTLLTPLHELLKSKQSWKWTIRQERAFQKAKSVLTTADVLVKL